MVLVALFTAAPVRGQEAPITDAKDADAVVYSEVERGLYFTGIMGATILLAGPGDAPGALSGISMGIAAGYDATDTVQIEAFFLGAQLAAPAGYVGLGDRADLDRPASGGDFSSFLVGARVRFAYLTLADKQNVNRLFLTLQGGGGVILSTPSTVYDTLGPAVSFGVGLRYFTRMRHFSLGFDLDASYGIAIGAIALNPNVSLTYTF